MLGTGGFTDGFGGVVLDPSWQVVSGLGSYSLSDNSGHLRYYLQGFRAYSGGWVHNFQCSGGWCPSLTLIRAFDGSNWTLRTKATYNIRWSFSSNPTLTVDSTGIQEQVFYIAFGEGVNDYLRISRGTDKWTGTNILTAYLVSGGIVVASNKTLRASDDIPLAGGKWLRHTYWYEIKREGQEITFSISYDGTNYTQAFKTSLTSSVGTKQRAIIDAGVWTTAGSYTDWDY